MHSSSELLDESAPISKRFPRKTFRYSWRRPNVVTDQVEIQIRTLDELLPELEAELGNRNLYLKLDTQGFDLEVLKGASQSIDKIRDLQTEASVKPIYSEMPDYATSIRTLLSLGFELSGIFPNNSGYFPMLIEFDCFMIAERYVVKAKLGTLRTAGDHRRRSLSMPVAGRVVFRWIKKHLRIEAFFGTSENAVKPNATGIACSRFKSETPIDASKPAPVLSFQPAPPNLTGQ